MFDFLPDIRVQELRDAPLRQVIAQVRFGSQSALGTHDGAGAIHDALGDMYPRLLAEQQQVVTMTPSGASVTSVPQFRLTDLEEAWAVVIAPEHLTLETSNYSTWTELRERLETALIAVTDVVKLRVRERVGLRYINHIKPDESGGFAGKVLPELLGPVGHEGWRSHLTTMLSQVRARDGEAQLLLRVGLAPGEDSPNPPYLIDIDCANDQPSPFQLDEALKLFDSLNDVGYRCFCWCVPSEYRDQLAAKG